VGPALCAWGGAWLGTSGTAGLAAAALTVLAGLGVGLLAGRRRGPVVVACLAAGLAALLAGQGRVAALHAGPVDDLARAATSAEVVLRVTGDPAPRASRPDAPAWQQGQVRVRARVTEVSSAGTAPLSCDAPVVVLAPATWGGLRPGQVVAASVRLREPAGGGPIAALALADDEPTVTGEVPDPFAAADAPRRALRDAVEGLPAGPAGLLPSLVVGDESLLRDEVRRDLQTTGLTHLTAVSGANVAIVLGAVLWSARWAGLRGWALPVTGVLSIVGFVLLARPEPSVVRAAAMGVVVVLGLVAGARGRGVAPLAVACLVLLLLDPWLSRSVGFALSCMATGGIVVLGRPWQAAAAAWMPSWLAAVLAVPLAAQVACTPMLVLLAERVSLASLPANLLAAAAVPPATVLGLVAALVGLVWPAGAHLVAAMAMVPTGWIVAVAERGAALPGASLPWQGGVLLAVALGLALALMTPVLLGSRWLSLLACLALVAVLLRPGPLATWPPDGWLVVACDVGQGDALVLNAAPGQAVVVDTGVAPAAVDRCLRDLGVVAVPLLVVSHYHADHVAGLEGVVADRPVGAVVTTRLADPPEQAAALDEWARSRGVPVHHPGVGEGGRVGQVAWRVLWPGPVLPTQGSAPNQASLVLRAEVAGVSVLLTGDIEEEAQRALAARSDLDVDVLKLPHHGSPDQYAPFLARTDPAVTLVSVGVDNTYGHPDAALLATLRDDGTLVARTDTDGDVAVTAGAPGELAVVRRGAAPR
jgi:competence protein ComEC